MVYQSVINTISITEFDDWVPVYDNTTAYNALSYIQCNDIELKEANPRKNNGFWRKLIRYIKKKEVSPLISAEEQNNEKNTDPSNTTYMKFWKEPFNLR